MNHDRGASHQMRWSISATFRNSNTAWVQLNRSFDQDSRVDMLHEREEYAIWIKFQITYRGTHLKWKVLQKDVAEVNLRWLTEVGKSLLRNQMDHIGQCQTYRSNRFNLPWIADGRTLLPRFLTRTQWLRLSVLTSRRSMALKQTTREILTDWVTLSLVRHRIASGQTHALDTILASATSTFKSSKVPWKTCRCLKWMVKHLKWTSLMKN